MRVAALHLTGADILAIHGVQAFRGGVDHVKISCPAHDDEHPSCSVDLSYGRTRCFSCGFRAGDVVALHRALGGFENMGAALRDLENRTGRPVPPLEIRPAQGKAHGSRARPIGRLIVVATWNYHLADGTVAFIVQRLQWQLPDGSWWTKPEAQKPHKIYLPSHPCGRRRHMPEPYASGSLRPLYRLPELLAADPSLPVYVVEGEPAADALRGIGWVATTSSGGCGVPHLSDWSPLAGRNVIVWPDNDDSGFKYAASVTASLHAQMPRATIRWVNVSELKLPVGGDAKDWVSRGASRV